MLFADAAPENIIIRQTPPLPAHLSGAAQGCGVEIAEDFQRDLTGKHHEGVYPDDMGQLFGKERQLREAAHRQEALQNECAPRMR